MFEVSVVFALVVILGLALITTAFIQMAQIDRKMEEIKDKRLEEEIARCKAKRVAINLKNNEKLIQNEQLKVEELLNKIRETGSTK